MGWNTLRVGREHKLLAGIPNGRGWPARLLRASYHFVPEEAADLVASTDYGGPITALVAKDNMAGTSSTPRVRSSGWR
jgi:glutamine amidotransferase